MGAANPRESAVIERARSRVRIRGSRGGLLNVETRVSPPSAMDAKARAFTTPLFISLSLHLYIRALWNIGVIVKFL